MTEKQVRYACALLRRLDIDPQSKGVWYAYRKRLFGVSCRQSYRYANIEDYLYNGMTVHQGSKLIQELLEMVKKGEKP